MPPTSQYERSTTAASRARLPEAVRAELDSHIEGRLLSVDPDAPAWVTHSKKVKRGGLFSRMMGGADPDSEHLTIVVIGARDLIWVTHGEKRGTNVMSTRLVETDVQRQPQELIIDDGANITGFPTSSDGVASRGSVFFGLGPPEGDRAYEALREVVRAAKAE
jgi:hypothetical protein